MPYTVGDTVTLDGIESVIVYDTGSKQRWGRYLCVDKNHDLSYYISGDDHTNLSNYNFGYEWGYYHQTTGTFKEIGTGLSNTNYLIFLNSQNNTLWSAVKQFRSIYTDGWFVPSLDELHQIYINCKNKNLLKNITTSFYDYSDTSPCYWSSSEYDKNYAYFRFSGSGFNGYKEKNDPTIRTRLCRYATPSLLNLKWEIDEN